MGRLKALPPRIKPLPNRLAPAPADRQASEKQRLRERDQAQPWRQWYGTQRWKDLRRAVWLRDAYTCQKTVAVCVGRYPAPNSPAADHIIPHRGDPALFWDINNLQTVSKEYHDREKQKAERMSWG